MYKGSAGLKLGAWESSQLNGIDKFDISVIEQTMSGLNELRKYTYKDYQLIQFTITNLILKNKKNNEVVIERKPREVK